jgi:hypothetical protein
MLIKMKYRKLNRKIVEVIRTKYASFTNCGNQKLLNMVLIVWRALCAVISHKA